MRISFFALILLFAIHAVPALSEPGGSLTNDELKNLIRKDHPRLFINKDTLPAIKSRAMNEEKELFNRMKANVDKILPDTLSLGDYGINSAENAFVYLVTGDKKYLHNTHILLMKSVAYYGDCYKKKIPVSWYGYSRINA